MNYTTDRERFARDYHAEQQPWRCVVCNKAVRPGRGDPCDCTRVPVLGWSTTVGETFARVTPHIEPEGVEQFKLRTGCCMEPGCMKISNHKGEHT